MEQLEYLCLACWHPWTARKADKELSLRWRQCPRFDCRSYDTIPLQSYYNIVASVKALTPPNPGGADIITALRQVLKELGVRFRPISTLNLALKVIEEVKRL